MYLIKQPGEPKNLFKNNVQLLWATWILELLLLLALGSLGSGSNADRMGTVKSLPPEKAPQIHVHMSRCFRFTTYSTKQDLTAKKLNSQFVTVWLSCNEIGFHLH